MKVARMRAGRPLLPGSARRRAAITVVCCAALVAVLGALVFRQATGTPLDHAVDASVFRWLGARHGLLLWLVLPGSARGAFGLSGVLCAGCLVAGRLNGAVLAGAAVAVANGLDEKVLKPLIHRTIMGDLSYPSGHATAVVAVGTVAVLLALPPAGVRAGRLRRAVPVAAVLLACVVAVGLIALRWHYFTDTVAGAAVGIGAVCGLAFLLDLPAARRLLARVERRPGAADDADYPATSPAPDPPGRGLPDDVLR